MLLWKSQAVPRLVWFCGDCIVVVEVPDLFVERYLKLGRRTYAYVNFRHVRYRKMRVGERIGPVA